MYDIEKSLCEKIINGLDELTPRELDMLTVSSVLTDSVIGTLIDHPDSLDDLQKYSNAAGFRNLMNEYPEEFTRDREFWNKFMSSIEMVTGVLDNLPDVDVDVAEIEALRALAITVGEL